MREPGFLHDPIDLRLAGEVRNVELAAADLFHIRERRPDEMLDTGFPGRTHRGRHLRDLVCVLSPEIGDQENAMRSCECSVKGLGAVEIRFDDFVGEPAVLGRIAKSEHVP